MKVFVIGATGGTGKALIREALAAGYQVVAMVRSADKLGDLATQCEVVQGGLDQEDKLTQALSGVDLVLSGLGPVKGNPDFAISKIVRALLGAMNKAGVRRLVAVTGAGVKDPNDEPSLVRTLIRGLMKLVAGKVLADSERSYRLIRESSLDWTVARVPILVDEGGISGALSGNYTPTGPIKMNRQAIAHWMVTEATERHYVHQAPMLRAAGTSQ